MKELVDIQKQVASLTHELDHLSVEEGLKFLAERFAGSIVFSTSFSIEDQLISHYIFTQHLPVKVFTLDTGRLFQETYSTWSRTIEQYQKPIQVFCPDQALLQSFTESNGPNAFYRSVELRKACCNLRKVLPLNKALSDQQVWVTGIRAAHSSDRNKLSLIEWDAQRQIIKYNPLIHYTTDQVMDQIRNHGIPYNPLHDKGFVSIGCAPCTRAVKAGEDFRAGRWWWEDPDSKECGLHVTENQQHQS
jgi:phosphoadenosine phosphosulfate reductase